MADAAALQANSASVPHLRRVLTLWDLIFYGIVLIQPIAPVPLYGVAQKLSDGHFVTIVFIAMVAMMITAFSYGRMAAVYPAAGSAYTYVGRGLNPHLGFLAGWAMILDYLLQPLINTVWISTALHERYMPRVPYVVWAALIVSIVTLLNLRGIKSSARANKVLLFFMFIVVGLFVGLAVYFLLHGQGPAGLLSTKPFYDPAHFDRQRIWMATSFAALTYIGFDGVTTLSEDVENPKRNVLLAVVLTCLFAGLFSGLESYLGARVWPNWQTFPNLETAFMDICRRVGGPFLFHAMGAIIIVAAFGSALTGGLGAARLLFGMGRDNVLPRKFFGYLSPSSNTPSYNLLLIGLLAFGGAVGLNYIGNAYEHAAELLNFGAFLAFMGVNMATFWQFTAVRDSGQKWWLLAGLLVCFAVYWWPFPSSMRVGVIVLYILGVVYLSVNRRRLLADTLLPLGGFVFCFLIWLNLNHVAKTVGFIWFVIGVMYVAVKTRGFRAAPVMIDFSDS
jgi:amino acid transporter